MSEVHVPPRAQRAHEPSAPSESPPTRSFASRALYALGPVACGLVLDLVDLATLGPIGLWIGFPVGALVTWFLTGLGDFGRRERLALTAASGLYCMLPVTHVLPIATAVGALGRFLEGPWGEGSANDGSA